MSISRSNSTKPVSKNIPFEPLCHIVGKWCPSENFLTPPPPPMSLPPTLCVAFWEPKLRFDAASRISGEPFCEPPWLGK